MKKNKYGVFADVIEKHKAQKKEIVKKAKVKKPKYKIGDLVFSWQNPTVKRKINRINLSDDGNYSHTYRLTFFDKDGYQTNSKWMNESSLYKTKKTK